MTKFICIALICFFPFISLCQEVFLPGYIITNSMDTIFGEIKDNYSSKNNKHCNFKSRKDISLTNYTPTDIKGYRFLNGNYYVSKEVTIDGAKERFFLEFIINGKVNVYYLKENNIELYFAQKGNDTIIFLDNSEMLYDWDSENEKMVENEFGNAHSVTKSSKYKGILKYTMSDTPELFKQIDNTTLNHKSVIDLAKNYHYKVCENEDCIIYSKDFEKGYKSVGVSLGYFMKQSLPIPNVQSKNEEYLKDNIISFGVASSFQLLAMNKNTQINFDLYYNAFLLQAVSFRSTYSAKYSQLNLPITVQYNFPVKLFRPYVNLGLGLSMLLSPTILDNGNPEGPTKDFWHKNLEEYTKFSVNLNSGAGVKYVNNNIDYSLGLRHSYDFAEIKTHKIGVELKVGYLF